MFRPVKVFDVSQTDGKPLPELASSLSGNVPNYEACPAGNCGCQECAALGAGQPEASGDAPQYRQETKTA